MRGAGFFLVNVSGINSLYAFLNFAIPIGSILLFSTLILMNKSLRFSQAWVDGAGSLAAAVARWWTRFALRRRAAVSRVRVTGHDRLHPLFLSVSAATW